MFVLQISAIRRKVPFAEICCLTISSGDTAETMVPCPVYGLLLAISSFISILLLWMSQEAELSTGIRLLANFLPPTFIFRFIRYGIYFCHYPAVHMKQEKNTFPLITEAKWEYLNWRRLGTSTVLFFQLQTQLKPVCSAFELRWKGKFISRVLL